ncbi:MAG TPA: FAD-binding oxidoreductase [Candidatus Saccharimonadia bacterium]|nr:FAD-binding oxidoreductase [Candidatus Saccharimonadia bacterium]
MKKAYLRELQSQLLGSATDKPEVLEYFSTDSSIFQVTPAAVVYPQNTADVRKTVQFVNAKAASGKEISIVARGKGTDQSGAAIGEGLQMVFPAHMSKLLRLDRDTVTVQPGILFKTLQQTLHTHGRWLPPYPATVDYSTVGGAVAQDSSGEKSVKYGTMRDFVKGLKVVLSDGSIIETHRLNGRELSRKKGLSTLEGEIYRKFDSLLLDHDTLIKKHTPKTSKNVAGYALSKVRHKDGSFDLGQIFVGSQGTLGLITEITLKTLPYNPRTTLVAAYFETSEALGAAVTKLRALGPCAMEMVDRNLLDFVQYNYPGDLADLLPEAVPKAVLLVEFDDTSQLAQKVKSGRAQRILARHASSSRVSVDPVEQVALWKIRRSVSSWMWQADTVKPALPFVNDGIVPPERLSTFLDKAYKLLAKHDLDAAIWGHAGDAHLHLQPRLDLSKKKDVDKLFTLGREFHDMVISLGGSPSGGLGDGLMRSLYLKDCYGEDMMELFATVKHIFDPLSILNPMKKSESTEEFTRAHTRSEYTIKHLDHVVYT